MVGGGNHQIGGRTGPAIDLIHVMTTSRQALVRAAARNNAEWCAAMCRAHGVAGEFGADAWAAAVRTPPYYPDAVTLEPATGREALVARIPHAAWPLVLHALGGLFPTLPVIGYEQGDDLTVALRHGFEPIGPLRVWTHRG